MHIHCRVFADQVVELARKLILAGLIGTAGRGSILQAVVATLVSFAFFAVSFREMPFDTARLNLIKIISEFQMCVPVVPPGSEHFPWCLATKGVARVQLWDYACLRGAASN